MSCAIQPLSAFQSTNLNSKIDCFGRLGDRIVRSLGAPLVSVEIHQDQLFENISIACEMYTKYAGYTREYLVFDSSMYERGKGIRLDHLFTLANPALDLAAKLAHKTTSGTTAAYLEVPDTLYVVQDSLSSVLFAGISSLSATFIDGLKKNQILDETTYQLILSSIQLSTFFSEASSIYDTLTGYHSTLHSLPSSIFASSPTLSTTYSNGLSTNQLIIDTAYNTLTSFSSSYPISSFFQSGTGLLVNYSVGDIVPSTLFLNNSALSAQFQNGLSANQILSYTEYNTISSNLNGLSLNYYLSVVDLSSYVSIYDISNNPFENYPTLSAVYPNGLSATQIVLYTEYNLLTSAYGSDNFPLSTFFTYSSGSLNQFSCTYTLSSNLFSNSVVLSSIYTNGISTGTILLSSDYVTLSTNFDSSLTNFYTVTTLSTQNIDLYYTALDGLNPRLFEGSTLSATYLNGISAGDVLSESRYISVQTVAVNPFSAYVAETYSPAKQKCGTNITDNNQMYNNMFDYDIMDYRKVIAVTDFEEGSTQSLNTLFSIEQTLAQQTYFSYAMGNYGFDLTSWVVTKNWLETREKVLATKRSIEFNDRTQILRIFPEPTDSVRFYGLISCFVEAPLIDLIKEPFVYQYALALSKISVSMVRGKYGSTAMFGGQIFSMDLGAQGLAEKTALEQKLYEGNSPGFGSSEWSNFLIG